MHAVMHGCHVIAAPGELSPDYTAQVYLIVYDKDVSFRDHVEEPPAHVRRVLRESCGSTIHYLPIARSMPLEPSSAKTVSGCRAMPVVRWSGMGLTLGGRTGGPLLWIGSSWALPARRSNGDRTRDNLLRTPSVSSLYGWASSSFLASKKRVQPPGR